MGSALQVRRVLVAAAIAMGCFTSVVPVAEASYPGRNGLIAFNRMAAGTTWIAVVRPDGTGLRQLPLFRADPSWSQTTPSWSPDGRQIAYCNGPDDDPVSEIWAADAKGRHARKVLSLFSRWGCSKPSWSPDGRRIAFTARRAIYTATISGRGRRALTQPNTELGRKLGDWGPAWSPKGDKIAYEHYGRSDRVNIWTMKPDGSRKRRLTHSPPHVSPSGPIWSPDGGRIMYTRITYEEGEGAVDESAYVMNSDGTGKHRLDPYPQAWAWSPDGRFIAFLGYPAYGFDFGIWIGELDGSGQQQVTNPGPEHLTTVGPLSDDYSPDWQPLPR